MPKTSEIPVGSALTVTSNTHVIDKFTTLENWFAIHVGRKRYKIESVVSVKMNRKSRAALSNDKIADYLK